MKKDTNATAAAPKKTATVITTKEIAKKQKVEGLSKANVEKAAKDAVAPAERETMYIYPVDAKTASAKKDFRRKARAAKKAFEKNLARLTKSNEKADHAKLKEIEGQFKDWKKGIYTKES